MLSMRTLGSKIYLSHCMKRAMEESIVFLSLHLSKVLSKSKWLLTRSFLLTIGDS